VASQRQSCLFYRGTLSWHSARWVSIRDHDWVYTGVDLFICIDLLYLHRSFFARAISDHPKDPLGSPYGTSVIAAYRSAGSLVALMRNLHTQLQAPSERMWFLWTHMFSCAVSQFKFCSFEGGNRGWANFRLDCPWIHRDTMPINEFGTFCFGTARIGLRTLLQSCARIPCYKSSSEPSFLLY